MMIMKIFRTSGEIVVDHHDLFYSLRDTGISWGDLIRITINPIGILENEVEQIKPKAYRVL